MEGSAHLPEFRASLPPFRFTDDASSSSSPKLVGDRPRSKLLQRAAKSKQEQRSSFLDLQPTQAIYISGVSRTARKPYRTGEGEEVRLAWSLRIFVGFPPSLCLDEEGEMSRCERQSLTPRDGVGEVLGGREGLKSVS